MRSLNYTVLFPDNDETDLKTMYFKRVRHIWSTITSGQTLDKEKQDVVANLEWTNSAADIIECWQQSSSPLLTNLILLKLTVIIERSLGNVLLAVSKSKTCPSLLSDLLKRDELREVFGEAVIDVLQTLMGHPDSLNLRNVLWHGFSMAGEIPSQ